MKRTIFIILLLATGIGIIAYPFIGNYLNQKNATKVAETYQKNVDKLSPEEITDILQVAQIYNENLLGQPAHDPFIPGSGIVMPDNYYRVLNVEGTMGQLKIPSIDVDLPIYHGTKDSVLRKAVGHLEGSAMPIGGKGTHTVLTSHTGLTEAKLFTDLTELKKGDHFYIHVLNKVLAYEVDQISVIEPEQTEALKAIRGKDYATLLTCTPYGINSHRLLVRGRRVPYHAPQKMKKKKVSQEDRLLLKTILLTTAIMGGLIGLNYLRIKRKNKQA